MHEETGIEWRQPVLDAVMRWSALLGGTLVVVLLISIGLRTPERLSDPGFLLMFGVFGATVLLRHRPGISYRTRALGFCGLSLLVGVSALYNVGLRPGPLLVSAFTVIASQLFLGRRAMLASLLVTTLGVVLAAIAHGRGLGDDGGALSRLEWLRIGASFAAPTASLALLVAHVVGKIEHSLLATSEALRRLRVTEDERAQARAALAETEAALARSQKLEAVGRLAAGVGHDFNNTLQVVLSWTSILRDERDPEALHEGFDALERAALSGSELTRRLLAFGRREVRAPTVCSSTKLVEDSAKSLRRLLPEDIAIELDLDASSPYALVDTAQISHVLLNLGVNARDAMPGGGVLSLRVRGVDGSELPEGLGGESARGRFLHLSVSDTGTGMSAATRAHVFEPFFTTKGERGTGLGLATAYAIVRQNSGFIQVESEEGQGATFHIYFPEYRAPLPEAVVSARRATRAAGALIMVAEDDPDVRQTMVRVLAAAGYRVLQTADAAAAMTELERVGAEVDVLCTDGIMPGGGTRQLIDLYLARRPDGQVIVCSGYVQEELLRRDIDAGAFGYLPKPFAPSELVERIDALMAKDKGVTVPQR